MVVKDYFKIFQTAFDLLGGAMHVIDASGNTVVYNEAMAKLEKIDAADVLGKSFIDVFSNLPKEQSTLFCALNYNKSTINKRQTYLNIYGKRITTINSTVPIIVDNKVIGAIEVARDISDIDDLRDTIIDFRKFDSTVEVNVAEDNRTVDSKHCEIKRYSFSDLIGGNTAFLEAVNIAKYAAENDAPVLIYGETGTGKELFSQSIHYEGKRRTCPFLAQNCAAIPENLFEGMLFGTSRGGFTGAIDRAGLFEQADGGTLLLDEISAMPYNLQSKLLRVLQEEYIRRVGGSKDIPVDVRVIATVNEPPEELIRKGTLRKDLYYRLGVINIKVPPLRERKDDIPTLSDHFLAKNNKKYNKNIRGISESAIKKMQNHYFSGNVRELENIIVSSMLCLDKGCILSGDDIIIESEYAEKESDTSEYNPDLFTMNEYIEKVEKEIIQKQLIKSDGNISKAAETLGMARQNLQYKIRKYDLIK